MANLVYSNGKHDVTNNGQNELIQEVEKQKIQRYIECLQKMLYETRYPETEDRTVTPRSKLPNSGITIAILSSPADCLTMLLQGGQACPGSVHLVLSKSWLSMKQSERDPMSKTVYLHKAITMYRGGHSYIDVFDPPRRVTYLMNNFEDQNGLKSNLDCPMSGLVDRNIDDNLWMRILISELGIKYPKTLALLPDVTSNKYRVPNDADIDIQKIDMESDAIVMVKDKVDAFLRNLDSSISQVIVKPIKKNPQHWKTSIFSTSNRDGICSLAISLLTEFQGAVIERFCSLEPLADENDDISFRVRVIACRGRCDRPIASSFICRVGCKNQPIRGNNTTPQSLETTFRQWRIDGHDMKRIKTQMREDSEKILKEVILQENNKKLGGRSDMIAVDFVLTKPNSLYVPVVIGVTNRRNLFKYQSYDFVHTNQFGQTVSPLIEMMCEKSQKYIMWGKVVVVLAIGGPSKTFMWSVAKDHNIKVILVDNMPDEVPDVAQFIDYDFRDHSRDEEHAINIYNLLLGTGLQIDGCCTICEDTGMLSAKICHLLCLGGCGLIGTRNAKKKTLTQNTIVNSISSDVHHFPPADIYSERCEHVETIQDIEKASISYPCIIKREYGGGAIGVKLVKNIEECKEFFTLTGQLNDDDVEISGLGFGTSMMMTKYLEGTEHDVNIVLYRKQLVHAFISDNGPTRDGYFTETSVCLPSRLPEDKRNQIITAAYQCCSTVGLESGVFNVEMMMTSTGPKLIEINARVGAFHARPWIIECYGIDLARCIYMCACDVKPHIYKPEPSGQIVGVTCLQSIHSHIWNMMDDITKLQNSGEILYNHIQSYDAQDEVDSDFEKPICYIGVKTENLCKAKERLLIICKKLGIWTTTYDIKKFTNFHSL